jgi:putative hydrolase of the HAD superfamily
MLTTLLLDFGSVVTFSVFEIMDVAEQRLGLPPGTLPWRGPLDLATDSLWRDMQADRITEREYWEKRAQEVGELFGKSWLPTTFGPTCWRWCAMRARQA